MTEAQGNIATVIANAWTEHTRATESQAPATTAPPYVYASRFNPCTRAMALDLLHPEDRGAFADDTLERFARGNEIERMIVARLSFAGRYGRFTVRAAQQRYEIRGHDRLNMESTDNRTLPVIVGKIDGMIHFEDGESVPFDVKSGVAVQQCSTLEDLFAGRWTRHMPYQLLAYCWGAEVSTGLFIIDKPNGPTFIEINLLDHMVEMEAFLSAAEVAVACQRSREEWNNDRPLEPLPPFIDSPGECLRCDHYKKSCSPPIAFGEGLSYIDSPELAAAAEAYTETAEAAAVNRSAWGVLTKALRGVEIGSINGRYDVVGKWAKSSRTVYPETCPSCQTKIEPTKDINPEGRFVLTVEPTTVEGGGGDDGQRDAD